MVYAPTPCLRHGCNNLAVNLGACQAHQPLPWEGSTRKQRLPKDWNTRRLIVLKRDKGICYLCKGDGADTVDHINAGDNHDLSNLAAVHDRVEPHCHRAKSAREGQEAQAAMRVKRRH